MVSEKLILGLPFVSSSIFNRSSSLKFIAFITIILYCNTETFKVYYRLYFLEDPPENHLEVSGGLLLSSR